MLELQKISGSVATLFLTNLKKIKNKIKLIDSLNMNLIPGPSSLTKWVSKLSPNKVVCNPYFMSSVECIVFVSHSALTVLKSGFTSSFQQIKNKVSSWKCEARPVVIFLQNAKGRID